MSRDLVGRIIDFECGDLSEDGMVSLFSDLIKTGMVWQLQGLYQRTARALIEAGFLSVDGDILEV